MQSRNIRKHFLQMSRHFYCLGTTLDTRLLTDTDWNGGFVQIVDSKHENIFPIFFSMWNSFYLWSTFIIARPDSNKTRIKRSRYIFNLLSLHFLFQIRFVTLKNRGYISWSQVIFVDIYFSDLERKMLYDLSMVFSLVSFSIAPLDFYPFLLRPAIDRCGFFPFV